MLDYDIFQWVLIFCLYGTYGWIQESIVISLEQKRIVNRGFLTGPIIPIYGFGAILIMIVSIPLKESLIAVFFVGMVSATVLELTTGILCEKILKVRLWDYSMKKFNYHGRICLESSIAWGTLSIMMVKIFWPLVDFLLAKIPSLWTAVIATGLFFIVIVDASLSIHAAIDLRIIMARLNEIRNDMRNIAIKLEEMITESSYNEELQKILARLTEQREQFVKRGSFLRDRLLRSYPNLRVKYYPDLLKELRERAFNLYKGVKKNKNSQDQTQNQKDK